MFSFSKAGKKYRDAQDGYVGALAYAVICSVIRAECCVNLGVARSAETCECYGCRFFILTVVQAPLFLKLFICINLRPARRLV